MQFLVLIGLFVGCGTEVDALAGAVLKGLASGFFIIEVQGHILADGVYCSGINKKYIAFFYRNIVANG